MLMKIHLPGFVAFVVVSLGIAFYCPFALVQALHTVNAPQKLHPIESAVTLNLSSKM